MLLVSDIDNVGSNNDIYLYVNNNTTASNYYTQRLTAIGSSVASVRYNDSYFAPLGGGGSNDKTLSFTNIKLTNNGYFTFLATLNDNYNVGTILRQIQFYGASTFTLSSITQLNIKGTISNGIEAGSRFTLYKLK